MNHPRSRKGTPLERLERIRAGLCVECGQPNDRAGTRTKAGKAATQCSPCLAVDHEAVAAIRQEAQTHRGDMAAALGLTPAQAADLTRRQRARK